MIKVNYETLDSYTRSIAEDTKNYNESVTHVMKWYIAEVKANENMAKALMNKGGHEAVVAYNWKDRNGRAEDETEREVYTTYEEAVKAMKKLKKENGGWVNAWIEVRPINETEKLQTLKAEIAKLTEELARLEKGE